MGDFSLSMDNLLKQVNGNVEKVVKKSVFDLTTAIIKDTPVDEGRLRANWQVSFNSPNDSILEEFDKSGRKAISKARASINSSPIPLVYWISNNLPYAGVVEFGLYPKNPKYGTRYELRDKDKFVTETGFVQLSENGYSKKAPQGMVRINVMRFNKFFKDNTR